MIQCETPTLIRLWIYYTLLWETCEGRLDKGRLSYFFTLIFSIPTYRRKKSQIKEGVFMKKRIISFLLGVVTLFYLVVPTFAEESSINTDSKMQISTESKVKSKSFDYPIKLETKEWKKLKSHEEQINVCQIADDKVQSMETNQLIETVLDYPLLVDIFAYDTFEEGIKAVSS